MIRGLPTQKAMRRLGLFVVLLVMLAHAWMVLAAPEGAQILSNSTENRTVAPAAGIATAGGTFTTLVLNGTTQTPRWKAYVGNVTGKLTLDDASGSTIYDWSLLSISGEVYASRSNSVGWSNVNCSNRTFIAQEEAALSVAETNSDSINRTFNNTIHRSFYVGGTRIVNSTCPAIATYINDSRQAASESALFQEVLLSDGASLVYSTILEPGRRGFDNGNYSFQLLVAENEFLASPTPYYFYLELG